ncbi:unnamed protein product [Symbiodinium natans]|uniref:Uncharacterized protein n=1 Tax=Symbiodinium natans TaxID=878477 RepID=A0A812PZ31_9DINO|nr:unnamed protein product [Symbiodinium natans]
MVDTGPNAPLASSSPLLRVLLVSIAGSRAPRFLFDVFAASWTPQGARCDLPRHLRSSSCSFAILFNIFEHIGRWATRRGAPARALERLQAFVFAESLLRGLCSDVGRAAVVLWSTSRGRAESSAAIAETLAKLI